MTPDASMRLWAALKLEHRRDRSYDDADASHILASNGTLVGSYDRGFLAAAAREALAQWQRSAA